MSRRSLRRNRFNILAIDVGAGTQNFLLYDGSFENSCKLILPSQTQLLAREVQECAKDGKHIVATGETMGGGPINHALIEHLEKGFRVCMTKRSALTVRDDLEVVRKKGIEVVGDSEASDLIERKDFAHIETSDIDVGKLRTVLAAYKLVLAPKIVAVAVEDHGVARKGQTDRECRFEHFKEFIPAGLERFGFSEPPAFYSRMMGVKRMLREEFPNCNHLIMDSKIASMFGALYGAGAESAFTVDVGNGHTTIASFEKRTMIGIFEHHTYKLSRRKFELFMKKFRSGTLTNEEIFDDGGHGCYSLHVPSAETILVTGPRRELFRGARLNMEFISPFGDVMLAGAGGLITCAMMKYGIEENEETES